MAPLPRVLVDTNVLFPFSVMDLMLALTEDGVHTILWTGALLDEWERVIVRSGRCSASSAAAVTAAVRKFFPDSEAAQMPLGCLGHEPVRVGSGCDGQGLLHGPAEAVDLDPVF